MSILLEMHEGDPLHKIVSAAEKHGFNGEFVFQSGVTEEGRPFLIVVGVGDGCETLHRALRSREDV